MLPNSPAPAGLADTPATGGLGTKVRWTATHRMFPALVGLGVSLGILSVAWIPDPRVIYFVSLPFVGGVLLGLSALIGTRGVRERRVIGLHLLVALAAVTTAMVPVLLFTNLRGRLILDMPMTISEQRGLVLLALSVGALAGWVACQAERFADRRIGLPTLGRTRWNPRRWGLAGGVGVAFFLLTTQGLGWYYSTSWMFRATTPGGMMGFFAIVWIIVGAVSMAVGLAVEVAIAQFRHSQTAGTP